MWKDGECRASNFQGPRCRPGSPYQEPPSIDTGHMDGRPGTYRSRRVLLQTSKGVKAKGPSRTPAVPDPVQDFPLGLYQSPGEHRSRLRRPSPRRTGSTPPLGRKVVKDDRTTPKDGPCVCTSTLWESPGRRTRPAILCHVPRSRSGTDRHTVDPLPVSSSTGVTTQSVPYGLRGPSRIVYHPIFSPRTKSPAGW